MQNQLALELAAAGKYNSADFLKECKMSIITRNAVKPTLTIACVVAWFLTGCTQPAHTETIERICLTDADRSVVMTAAEKTLSQMHFGIEKFDIESGYIRTYALSGAQAFEFWRSDNVGSFNSTEANLHSIRRSAQLNVTEQSGRLCVDCAVKVERLSLPERQVSIGQTYAMHSESERSLQRIKVSNEQKKDMTWIDLGRDSQLETEILKRIEKNITTSKKESTQ